MAHINHSNEGPQADGVKMPGNKYCKKILLGLLAWICLTLLVIGYRNQSEFNHVFKKIVVRLDPPYRPDPVNNTRVLTASTATAASGIPDGEDGCKGFSNDAHHPSTVQYFVKMPAMSCKASTLPNFLYLAENGNVLKVDRKKVKKLKATVDYCKYASITRAEKFGDLKVVVSPFSKTFTQSISLPKEVDNLWGLCYRGNTQVGVSYFSVVRKNETLEAILKTRYDAHVQKHKPKETMSVLMIGIDGTSKLNFARQMPKTRSFVLDTMRAIELYRVNKVGLNTFPNVIPMLTGKSEEEIRENWSEKQYFDKIDHHFLWDEFRLAGYRTTTVLDRIRITAFHYQKNGWDKPKIHYSNRPMLVRSEGDKSARKPSKHCVGDVDEITKLYEPWLEVTRIFNNSKTTPYFGYSFMAHVTHDNINKASSVDEIYLSFFQKLWAQNSLNNTLIVFFSDHGSRFGAFRSTFRGMLEDSNPFMFFIFPPWFESRYPKISANFRKNQNRLTTNYDVHATLKDILNFQGDELLAHRAPPKKARAVSLFEEMSERRTCDQAGIPLKFCNCRNFSTIGVSAEVRGQVSRHMAWAVVAKTKGFRSQCVALTLNATISVMSLFTPQGSAQFFQTTIRTSPGGAVYEAIIKYATATKVYSTKGDIARTNMYRGQADCINDPRTQPFCYCRNLLGDGKTS